MHVHRRLPDPLDLVAASGRARHSRHWHATRTLGQSGNDGRTALHVEVVSPLSCATTGIKVITTGRSAEARAGLPLRWE